MQALRGKYHYARGNADEALACFERIEGERCSDSAVWYLSALLRREKGDIPGALEEVLKKGDFFVFLGAGDVWRQGLRILERLG